MKKYVKAENNNNSSNKIKNKIKFSNKDNKFSIHLDNNMVDRLAKLLVSDYIDTSQILNDLDKKNTTSYLSLIGVDVYDIESEDSNIHPDDMSYFLDIYARSLDDILDANTYNRLSESLKDLKYYLRGY